MFNDIGVRQPILYMLVGVPASGKTTWVKNKTDFHPGTLIASTDEYLERYAKENNTTYNEIFKDKFKDADNRLNDLVKNAIQYDYDLVWDQTNTTVKSRAKKLKKIPPKYKKIAVVFEIPEAEELERRLNSRPGKIISKTVMDTMIEQFVIPTLEEGFDDIIFAT